MPQPATARRTTMRGPIPPTASPRSDDPAQRRRSPKARPPLVAMRRTPVLFAGRRCRAALCDSRNSVRIKTIEPIAISLPMKKPVKMAGETVPRADNILVRIETDDGAVGWGEAASAPTMTGETVASMMAADGPRALGRLTRPAGDFV